MKTPAIIHALIYVVFLAACSNGTGNANAQPDKNQSLDSFIRKRVDEAFKYEGIPGIMVGILENGKRTYYSAGFADPDKKMVFDSTTIFEIGSITKTFTAYIVESVLREKGISDTTSIFKYLPDSVQQNKTLEKITFLSLLNHSSGLPRLPGNMNPANQMDPYADYTLQHLYAYLKTAVPRPDGKSNYSNLGMGLVGVLAERISGKSYEKLLSEYIFNPFRLGKLILEDGQIENKSQGYLEKDKAVYWNLNVHAPAGAIKSSASSILTYLQKISIPVNDSSKQLIEIILKPTITIHTAMRVARAWHTSEQKGKPVIYWHNGGTYGFSTYGAFIKGYDKAVIVVVNQSGKNDISDGLGTEIMKKILE